MWHPIGGSVSYTPDKWPRCCHGAAFCKSSYYLKPKPSWYTKLIHHETTFDGVKYYVVRTGAYSDISICRDCWRHIRYQDWFDRMKIRKDLDVAYRKP